MLMVLMCKMWNMKYETYCHIGKEHSYHSKSNGYKTGIFRMVDVLYW